MTTDLPALPDPEFRAHLEWEVTRALGAKPPWAPGATEAPAGGSG